MLIKFPGVSFERISENDVLQGLHAFEAGGKGILRLKHVGRAASS